MLRNLVRTRGRRFRLLFVATTNAYGTEWWVTDGGVPALLKDITADPTGSDPIYPAVVGEFMYFLAFDGTNLDFWRTDGSPANTINLTSGMPATAFDSCYNPLLGRIGDYLLFVIDSVDGALNELWVTDGTPEGTVPLMTVAVQRDYNCE